MRNSFLFLICFTVCQSVHADHQLNDLLASIKIEQTRIDLLDQTKDNSVTLKSNIQSRQATQIYLINSQKITENVVKNYTLSVPSKLDQLTLIENILKSVNGKNIHFYTQYSPTFDLILKIQNITAIERLTNILRNNVVSSLKCIPFFIHYDNIAKNFLLHASKIEPTVVLRNFNAYKETSFSNNILDEVAAYAPMKIKTYLHSWNTIHQRIKASKNPITQKLYDIYEESGPISRAYILLNDVVNGKISIDQAHTISKMDKNLFPYLIEMQAYDIRYGVHSVDEALKYQCLKKVNVINDLHDENDAARFKSLEPLNAEELYILMVYSEEEIYTSTFLGMYDRLIRKIPVESTFEFLYSFHFKRFRTFVKMCAGYNKIDDFLSRMGEYEKQKLFGLLVEEIEKENDPLGIAVTLVDTYGSLEQVSSKLLFEQSITNYHSSLTYVNPYAQQLYATIMSVCNINQSVETQQRIDKMRAQLEILSTDRLFKGDKNIQQHFFFDDEDGRASYNHFIATFNSKNWEIVDMDTYIILRSTAGKKIEIYANKPETEYAGQKAIKTFFKSQNRWPDIVVHRGHSYFVDEAIESLTPNAEIVFLGSCGGYNIISQVLKYTPDAQIISSKQIGTLLVNDRLCYMLNETIRKGENVDWEKLWNQLNTSFVNGSVAYNRFQDYIPPHKNLGALLISAYRSIL